VTLIVESSFAVPERCQIEKKTSAGLFFLKQFFGFDFTIDFVAVTTPTPPPRPWIPLARPSSTRPACKSCRFCRESRVNNFSRRYFHCDVL
jgi:hypothetical protein